MLKRILFIVFMFAVFAIPVYAEEITVQGENYDRIYTNEPVSILPEGHENPVLVIAQWRGPTMEYTVEYDFEVQTAGGYELSAVVTEIDSAYTSNFYFSINGGEYVYAGDVFKKISKPGTSYDSNSMYLYTLGNVELKSGKNTIKFMINEGREIQTNMVLFYMDYFTLTKQAFGQYAVIPSKPSAVFEPTDDVGFTVGFSDYPGKSITYSAVIEDYFHNKIAEKNFVLASDSMTAALDFGRLPYGWYRLMIYNGTETIYDSGFSVVHNKEERKENPHFAIDFAGMALTSGKTEVKHLSRAVRLAGINTVRERYYWSYSDVLRKYNNETISGEGLDVINMFHDSPSSLVGGGYMADDLFEVYNFQKSYAQNYEGLVDYMEVWNEEDTSFATETADRYAAFLKAAAIGIRDGSSIMGISHGGFADSPADTRYMDICMLNDFMEYSELYNYHAYASGGKDYNSTPSLDSVELRENRDILTAYGYDNRRSWVSEGGISISDGVELSRRQQARASVINNVQSIANGNDKHFLFVVPQYAESGNEYGIFCKDKTPSPAYTSLENFTYHMGKGEYKGIFADLPENTCGYLFNNGEKDIGVFWAKTGEAFIQAPSEIPILMIDLMGNEKVVYPVNGVISVPVTMDPIYLIFEESVGAKYYSEFKKQKPVYENAEIPDSKKIVMQQTYESRSYVDEKNKGYLIYKNDDNICSLKVYNFSDKEQTGVINAKISAGFTVDKTKQEVTIPAMSSVEVTYTVRVAENVTGAEKGFLQFSGVMNGEEITKSTALIRCQKADNIELSGIFDNAQYASNWQTSGSSSSGTIQISHTDVSGELKFDINLEGNGWAYPNFKVSDPSVLTGSTGIKFSVGADANVSQALLHCFVYMKDGRKYFEGNSNGKTIKAGYADYYFPWDEMVRQYLPEGVDESKGFAIEDIAYIAIGVNLSGTKTASYKLKNIGWYISDIQNDVQYWDSLEISGAENGAVYYKGMAPIVTATMPEAETVKNVKVYLSGQEYNGYTLDGKSLIADLNKLDKGVYTLLVTAEDDFGYIYRDSVDFIIQ